MIMSQRKKILPLLLGLLLMPCQLIGQETTKPELPAAIKSALDRKFPGWKFAPVSDEIRRFLRENVSTDTRPEMISGDFDGNGRLDYAVLIEHGNIFNEKRQPIGKNIYVVAFLRKGAGFKLYVLEKGNNEYLALSKKGEKDYSYQTDQNFVYAHDAVFAGIFDKGGSSFIYRNGRFHSVITSD